MTIYKIYEETTIKGMLYPGVNEWIATFTYKSDAEEYFKNRKKTDFTSDRIEKRTYMTTETITL